MLIHTMEKNDNIFIYIHSIFKYSYFLTEKKTSKTFNIMQD